MKALTIRKIAFLCTAVVMLVSCAKAPEAALLPLPKQVEYTGGSVKADTPVTETLVDAIPEAPLGGNEAYRLIVTRKGITIEATTPQGLWNGRQTLRQLQISPRDSLGRNVKNGRFFGRNDNHSIVSDGA